MNFFASVTLFFNDKFSAGARQAQGAFGSMAAAAKSLGKADSLMTTASQLAIATSMTEPFRQRLATALAEPSNIAGALESSMGAVGSILDKNNATGGDVQRTFAEMKAAALDWARGTADGSKLAAMGAAQFASTSYQMLSAGLNARAAIAATGTSAILAKATMGDAGEAANLLAVMYNNMGNKAADANKEMANISDTLARTQGLFQIPQLSQLTEGLKYGVPAAKQYGLSIEQLSTIIGQLNTSGLQGSMAGTSFAQMMNHFIAADMGGRGKQALKFGIAYTASGGMDVIKTLQNIIAKYGPLDKLTARQSVLFRRAFGDEGLRALMLLGTSMDSLTASYKEVASASGAASRMAGAMANTYEDRVKRLKTAAEAYKTALGEDTNKIQGFFVAIKTSFLEMTTPLLQSGLGKVLTPLVAAAGFATEKTLGFLSTGLQTAAQLAMIAAAAQNAGGYVKLFGGLLTALKGSFAVATSGMYRFIAGTLGVIASHFGYVPAVGSAAMANVYFAASIWSVLWPILLIGVGIAGVILILKHWGTIWSWVQSIAERTARGFVIMWNGVKHFFVSLWQGITQTFSSAFVFIWGLFDNNAVQAALITFLPILGLPLVLFKNWARITGFFAVLWADITTVFHDAVGAITSFLKGLWNVVKAPFKAIGDFFAPLFGGAKKSGKAGIEAFATGIAEGSTTVSRATAAAFAQPAEYFPHSDAPRGPFSRLTESGRALMSTFARGVDAAPATRSIAAAFMPSTDYVSQPDVFQHALSPSSSFGTSDMGTAHLAMPMTLAFPPAIDLPVPSTGAAWAMSLPSDVDLLPQHIIRDITHAMPLRDAPVSVHPKSSTQDNPSQRPMGTTMPQPLATHIHIDRDIVIQAASIKSALDFVEVLMAAAGVSV